LRAAESAAEKEGVRRAEAALEAADLILWVVSPENKEGLASHRAGNTVIVGSKADLYSEASENDAPFDVWVSAKTGFGMDKLAEIIKKRLALSSSENDLDLITDRQYEEVLEAAKETESALASQTLDIAAFHLTRGANRLKRAEGKEVSEETLDAVFRKFCIGK
jgi:tRNA modification GTPase